ncbi:MAG TPA: LysR family transcriptional regulator [Oceanospirillales bacterium]|nr:LysR family transcriptional regulator [Oceanospirillaceae bacterium]MAR01779.1 LysR family transcriptional regulator [Oceanospirillaceae bacterium]HBS42027.1 LysR family transcriptional regulator [Oceanospirillales bacterium]|tara:strand:- start:1404 stop:2339 length:936 start_codon:yes stop_codon:yes gene_type:complete
MDKLEAMRVFTAVADCQSFVSASRELDLSAPAVTRSIAQLEQSLGVKLFNRTTRQVRLTDVGMRYYEDARRILEDVEQAEATASGSYAEPKGVLSLTAPVLFGQKYIVPVVAEYLQQNPAVSVDAMFYDRVSNILDEGLDVAIRIGHLKDSSFYATEVGSIQRVVCASPEYLKKHGTPQQPSDLTGHEIIHALTVEPSTTWRFESTPQGKESVRLSPRLRYNQNSAAIAAACMGMGITRVMSYQVAEELNQGSLTRILQDFESAPLPVHIVYMEGRQTNAKIRAFVDLAVKRLRENPYTGYKTSDALTVSG